MDIIKATSVLWEWRVEVRIEPKKIVGLPPWSRQWVFLRKVIRAFLPKHSMAQCHRLGWQSGKAFQMQAVATKPFCFVDCLQAGRGLQAPTSVHKHLIRSHVYCLGAAPLSLGEMPSEAAGCYLVLLNNDQVFTSFFLFSFEIISSVTLSLSTPHPVGCYLCLNPVPKVSFWFWWGLVRIYLLASLLRIFEIDSSQCQIRHGKYKDSSNTSCSSGGKKKKIIALM